VSHEIRTPLTVLSGFIETMAAVKLSPQEQHRVIELMTQQAQRMQTLVADLLTLAQLEGSPPPPPDRWVSTGKLVQQAQADAAALSAGRHQLSFVGDPAFEIAGSESELQSALTNLVSNAIRYTPEGGRIEVRVAPRPDGSAELAVQDSGVGIEKEHIPRLTERFYRVDGSRSRETGGTGLGLSIVKHVIQRHQAQLQVVSELGKGSTFKLIFPEPRIRRVGPALLSA
jgi:two-component system phosphate regulon sensor histidine kinase PhoR